MKLTIAQVAGFAAEWRKHRLTDDDLVALEKTIMEHPDAGAVGKRGATRVCYVVFAAVETAYLLTLFAKNEKSNLSAGEKAMYKKWMTIMKGLLE